MAVPPIICRLCLVNENNMESIFSKGNDLAGKIFVVTSIQMTEIRCEGFPNSICEYCKSKLITAFEFKSQCLRTNEKLMKAYSDFLKNSQDNNFCNEDQMKELIISKQDKIWEMKQTAKEVIISDDSGDDNNNDDDSNDEDSNDESPISNAENIEKADTPEVKEVTEEELFLDVLNSMNAIVEIDSNNIRKPKRRRSQHRHKGKEKKIESFKMNINPNKEVEKEDENEVGTICEICGKTRKYMQRHMMTHSQEKFHKCPYCNKGFTQTGNLKNHINIHTGNKPYKCNLCEKAFGDPNSLKCHKIAHHNGERKYVCTICGNKFAYTQALNAHVKTHLQNRQEICSYCSKAFLTKQGLKYHLRIHTGEKPYKCEFCPKGFTNSWNLSTHRRVHTKEQPYICNYKLCNMKFTYKNLLVSHIKKHETENSNKQHCLHS